MHKHQFFTWTTHTAETTTLLEATRLQKLYTYMCNIVTEFYLYSIVYICNIVTEFYLYSIVYIYLINSRLDVTHSVRHHFRTIQTLSNSKNQRARAALWQVFIGSGAAYSFARSANQLQALYLLYFGISASHTSMWEIL